MTQLYTIYIVDLFVLYTDINLYYIRLTQKGSIYISKPRTEQASSNTFII